MLDTLTARLAKIVKTVRGEARLTETNIQEALREVRVAQHDGARDDERVDRERQRDRGRAQRRLSRRRRAVAGAGPAHPRRGGIEGRDGHVQ